MSEQLLVTSNTKPRVTEHSSEYIAPAQPLTVVSFSALRAKSVFDRLLALVLLVAFIPLFLLVALLILIDSPGPIFFKQERVGRSGKHFKILKFRTMIPTVIDESEWQPANGLAPGGIENYDRRTAIGKLLRKWYIDELPQLINVVSGSMSLVGPRPERPEYFRRYCLTVDRYNTRVEMKPGLTGAAQIEGWRGQSCITRRAEADSRYIASWSFFLDIRILFRTLQVVASGSGE